MSESIENMVERIAQVQLLKFTAGYQVQCPGCGNIMDWQNTVILEIKNKATGEAVFTKGLCGDCFNRCNIVGAVQHATEKLGTPCEAEVTDGRLFADEFGTMIVCKVADKAATFKQVNGKGEYKEIVGRKIEFQSAPWAGLFLYRHPETKFWWVCDADTGCGLSGNESRWHAIAGAARGLVKNSEEKFRKSQAKARRLIARNQKAAKEEGK